MERKLSLGERSRQLEIVVMMHARACGQVGARALAIALCSLPFPFTVGCAHARVASAAQTFADTDAGPEQPGISQLDGNSSQPRPQSEGGSSSSNSAAAEAGAFTESGTSDEAGRGPTPATAGVSFPFPQNRQSVHCIYPSGYRNADVLTTYMRWKNDLVTSDGAGGYLRVRRLASDGIDACRPLGATVSEGIGYGMLMAVYMGDQSLFDGFWLFEQAHLDPNGLMNWAPEGSGANCGGAASDADEDMAFALVMADRQWGGQGSIGKPYKQAAIETIGRIWNTEIFQGKWLRAGDGNWATNSNVNPSYLAPAYYRVFQKLDTDPSHNWSAVIDQSYATIADALTGNGNQNDGLVPAWCDDSSLVTCRPAAPGTYQYDSCRTPFRVGLDWCWFGEARAKSYVQKTSTFFAGVGADRIADGYALDGTPMPPHVGQLAAAFVGPAAVGAMSDPAFQTFVDVAYGEVASGTLLAGGAYYEESWTVLAMLMLSGNFLDYTSL